MSEQRSSLLSSLRRRMVQALGDRQRQIYEGRVARVLNLLTEDHLATGAAIYVSADEQRQLLFECNFIEEVWDDPRIAARIAQFSARGVKVEKVRHEREINGHRYSRQQIRVTF